MKVIPLLQAFSSVIFCICGKSRGLSASAELLVIITQLTYLPSSTYIALIIRIIIKLCNWLNQNWDLPITIEHWLKDVTLVTYDTSAWLTDLVWLTIKWLVVFHRPVHCIM